jgi:hypothetical protein
MTSLETLDEINAREHAIRDRAWRAQRVLDEVGRCQRNIERLTPSVAAFAATIDVLTRIEELAAQLPIDAHGTFGHIARDQIRGTCLVAKTGQQKRCDREQRDLTSATTQLPALEAQLRAIEQE